MEIKNSILIEWREKIDNWMWKIYESEEEKQKIRLLKVKVLLLFCQIN